VSESTCPFCSSALGEAFRATPARRAPRDRLTRAALLALGTGVALTPACSSKSSEPMVYAAYGAEAFSDSGDVSSEAAAETGPPLGGASYGCFPCEPGEPVTDDGGIPDAADASPHDSGDATAPDASTEADAGATAPDAADAGAE
jgi:hypothetical protein